jgi:hypothetical protein
VRGITHVKSLSREKSREGIVIREAGR